MPGGSVRIGPAPLNGRFSASFVVKVSSGPSVVPPAVTATKRKWYVVDGCRLLTTVVQRTACAVPARNGVWAVEVPYALVVPISNQQVPRPPWASAVAVRTAALVLIEPTVAAETSG